MSVYVEHANITVSDLDASLKFLQCALPELAVRGRGEARGRRWLHIGTDVTYVALEQPPELGDTRRRPYADPGVNHVGFVVDDVDAVRERLHAEGYQEGISAEMHPHRRRIYFYDGDGSEWEFVEYLSDDPGERNDYSLPA
jgi:catechol 2,3-dioxygenase-like lactoylglutathione lyase family enzyme